MGEKNMRHVNLMSIACAKADFEDDHFLDLYLKNFGIELKSVKETEWSSIQKLIKCLVSKNTAINNFENFFWGYTIPQISKEFDLLRINSQTIINIELKSTNTGSKMLKQLIENKYYLEFLKREEVINYTFVADEEKLYKLNHEHELEEVTIDDLRLNLGSQNGEFFNEDINGLFNPSNYLVSPFNSTKEFLNNNYFLTDHQINIKKQIIDYIFNTSYKYFSIQGGAGTGKTLLAYDIIKDLREKDNSVLIFHCGVINEGHEKLQAEGWNVAPIKDLATYNLNDYKVILLDEVQRIYLHQFKEIIEFINKEGSTSKVIFSFDKKQCLAGFEIDRDIPSHIDKLVNKKTSFKLTTKIRTNKELASFIQSLFDQSSAVEVEYSNIDIQYFSKVELAKKYLTYLSRDTDWKVINFTESSRTVYPYDEYLLRNIPNSHKVVGQEFDNVVAVIDEYFYYNDRGHLDTKGWASKPYYHPTKMLYQNVSRARKKLKLIIIKNEEVLNYCLETLSKN
ncbi:ATP-binding protein [Bacillus sp. DC4300-2b2]|uniref:ATP-binding protein n=1 Tax=Bacillus sp. DC4300-2b2 TaxID=2809038 RepID=UPI003CEB7086